MRKLQSGTRVVADTLLGWLLVAAGLVMLVTPGPGLLAVVAGLAVLSRHYRWARHVRATVHQRAQAAGARLRRAPTATACESRTCESDDLPPFDRREVA